MDHIAAVGAALSLLRFVNKVSRINAIGQYESLKRDYGHIIAFLLVHISTGDTADQHRRLEKVILVGGDEEALAFRQAMTDECNMTAVAVRLFLPV